GHIPCRARSCWLAQQELTQHAERVVPKRIARKGRPLRRVACNFLEPLESRPICREIVLKLNAPAHVIPAQRAGIRQCVEYGCVATIERTDGKAMLKRGLTDGKLDEKPMNACLLPRPVSPKPIRNGCRRQCATPILEGGSGL